MGSTSAATCSNWDPGAGRARSRWSPRTTTRTVLERDPRLAERLRRRFGKSVTVVHGDATALPWERSTFGAVVCFTVLHHLRSVAAQDRLFAEAARVLVPGGVLAGSDSRSRLRFRVIHLGDTCTLVDPNGLPERLRRAGFSGVSVNADERAVRFAAHVPDDTSQDSDRRTR